MDEQMGLSQRGMEQQPQQGEIAIEDVIKALMQGVSPEELIKAGVPAEMVQQAVQMIQQQQQQQQEAPAQGGLSQAGLR